MDTQVTFRHFNTSHPDLQELANEYLNKLEKYNNLIVKAEVIFNNETVKNVEIIVHVKGDTLVIKEEGDEFKKIIHGAADRMARQLKKHKEKISGH